MISYLFPGQGSQTRGMGGILFDKYPELIEKADNILDYSIKTLCLFDEKHQLNQTQYTQPAIYIVNALTYFQKIKETGITPDFVAGHSLGEYNALLAAGVISFENGLNLVKKRGELMTRTSDGAMAAVLNLTENQIKRCLEDNGLNNINIANYNSATQIVISGLQEDINQAQACFEEKGADFIPLNTSGAFHSRYMKPAKIEFNRYLEQFTFAELKIPVISNVHAKPYQQDQIRLNLANQITHSVKWQQSMMYLLEQGVFDFEEIGMGEVLGKLMVRIQTDYASTAQVETVQPRLEYGEATIKVIYDHINDWNRRNPIGTKVSVVGFGENLKTRSNAMMILGGHRIAIYLEGYKGYFTLDNISVTA